MLFRFLLGGDRMSLREDTTLEPRISLCLSGSGVRAAAYNLGILQYFNSNEALTHDKESDVAKHTLRYISTVSAGSATATAFLSSLAVLSKNKKLQSANPAPTTSEDLHPETASFPDQDEDGNDLAEVANLLAKEPKRQKKRKQNKRTPKQIPKLKHILTEATQYLSELMQKKPNPHKFAHTQFAGIIWILLSSLTNYLTTLLFFITTMYFIGGLYDQIILECVSDSSLNPLTTNDPILHFSVENPWVAALLLALFGIINFGYMIMSRAIRHYSSRNAEKKCVRLPSLFKMISQFVLILSWILLFGYLTVLLIVVVAVTLSNWWGDVTGYFNFTTTLESLFLVSVSGGANAYVVYKNFVQKILAWAKTTKARVAQVKDSLGLQNTVVLALGVLVISAILLIGLISCKVLLWIALTIGCEKGDDSYSVCDSSSETSDEMIYVFLISAAVTSLLITVLSYEIQDAAHFVYKSNITSAYYNPEFDERLLEDLDIGPTVLVNTTTKKKSRLVNKTLAFGFDLFTKFRKPPNNLGLSMANAMGVSSAGVTQEMEALITKGQGIYLTRIILAFLNLGLGKWVARTKEQSSAPKTQNWLTKINSVLLSLVYLVVFIGALFMTETVHYRVSIAMCLLVASYFSMMLVDSPIRKFIWTSPYKRALSLSFGMEFGKLRFKYLSDGSYYDTLGLLGLLKQLRKDYAGGVLNKTHRIYCFDVGDDPEGKLPDLLPALYIARDVDHSIGAFKIPSCDYDENFGSPEDLIPAFAQGFKAARKRLLLVHLWLNGAKKNSGEQKHPVILIYVKCSLLENESDNIMKMHAINNPEFPSSASNVDATLAYSFRMYAGLGRRSARQAGTSKLPSKTRYPTVPDTYSCQDENGRNAFRVSVEQDPIEDEPVREEGPQEMELAQII